MYSKTPAGGTLLRHPLFLVVLRVLVLGFLDKNLFMTSYALCFGALPDFLVCCLVGPQFCFAFVGGLRALRLFGFWGLFPCFPTLLGLLP